MNIKSRIRAALTLAAVACVSACANLGASKPSLEASALAESEHSKAIVMAFFRDAAGGLTNLQQRADKYLSDDYIQHNPLAEQGRAGFVKFFTQWYKEHPDQARPHDITEPTDVIAEKDLVMFMFDTDLPEPKDQSKTYKAFWFDLFRVKGDKVVEHWDSQTKTIDMPME